MECAYVHMVRGTLYFDTVYVDLEHAFTTTDVFRRCCSYFSSGRRLPTAFSTMLLSMWTGQQYSARKSIGKRDFGRRGRNEVEKLVNFADQPCIG